MADNSKYIEDIRKYSSNVDEEAVNKIVRHLGIALRNRDSALVSATDPKELERVRESWLKKKLGLERRRQARCRDRRGHGTDEGRPFQGPHDGLLPARGKVRQARLALTARVSPRIATARAGARYGPFSRPLVSRRGWPWLSCVNTTR